MTENQKSYVSDIDRLPESWQLEKKKNLILKIVLRFEIFVTCGEKSEFKPQRPCSVSQDINAFCKDVTQETSQRHRGSPEDTEFTSFFATK